MLRKREIFIGILLMVLFVSCAQMKDTEMDNLGTPDYSKSSLWICEFDSEYDVDVFYVYPTVSHNESGTMDINNEDERALAKGIYKAQASVFEGSANIYAPYYRQMSTGVKLPDDPNVVATDLKEFKLGASDVKAAFKYYIENLNDGRPFMLASHSQGSMALIELLKDEFGKSEELRNNLVAAYIIGYTVTDEDLALAKLEAATSASDTGVVITYNTQSDTSIGGPMLLPGANCINPLNWKTDGTKADASQNKGAVFFNDSTGEFLREVPNYCGALINTDNGALTTKVDEELEIGPYPEGVFHRYDYAFWYRNLEENIKVRVDSFLNLPSSPNY